MRCAAQFRFDPIVRLTADNPLTDVAELDRLIELHLESDADYTSSFRTLPIGIGAEIFSFNALARSHKEGLEPHHREHVNEYIQENPSKFRIQELHVAGAKARPNVRLTVDTESDYVRICDIFDRAQSQPITTEEAIHLCTHSA
jgi:spore coat polysaccharide biosynthesis protein SpsF